MLAEFIRYFSPLSEPIGWLWLGLLATAIGMAWRRKWRHAGMMLAPVVFLSVIGSESFSPWLMASLERPYVRPKQQELPEGDVVVMLGGSHRPSQNDLFGFEMSDASDRALTALELMRQKKGKALVLGGSTLGNREQELYMGSLLQTWIKAWGLTDRPVYFLQRANDTRAEALRVKELARQHGWRRIVLVTSAYHLRRSEAVFKSAGLNVLPVGCDFQAVGVRDVERAWSPFPRLDYIRQLHLYMHEQVGWLMYLCSGWLNTN